ncbi:MAG: LPXTG cell wall anchor domain-containing protein [Lachnospiraceae bacterium]|nr:LPXTG cell wall anchor domain-containing protein [Lachnospiraceae bacterium]
MGFELPHTGGSGTGHFYILGILMTGIAGVGLLMKRKWRTEVHG